MLQRESKEGAGAPTSLDTRCERLCTYALQSTPHCGCESGWHMHITCSVTFAFRFSF